MTVSNLSKLPTGVQDFEDLRSNNYLYIDKTQYIRGLISQGKPYFLARPRRFGKSLFLSTLKAYFEGKRHLFDGLDIASVEKEWIQYPVIYIDMNAESYIDLDSFHTALDTNLRNAERIWGVNETDTSASARFISLIRHAQEKSGKKVVVLVDEYDKPLISTMDNPDLNDSIRKILKGFYAVLKTMDADLRFVMLTGVTKFSKVSIFSDINNLVDISMDENYAGICGITETELLKNFQPEIQALAEHLEMTTQEAINEMKKRYDGYRFAKKSEDVYNPFSLLLTFMKRDFGNYWFETGTPSMLVKIVKEENLNPRDFDKDIAISATDIEDYRHGETSIVPLLYQSGYLTIKSYNKMYNEYNLGFPNEEVKYGFLKALLPQYTPQYNKGGFTASRFVKSLRASKTEEFMEQLQAYYASIPYDVVKKEFKREQFYQFVFYQLFTLMGQFVETEVKSSKGRADAIVKTETTIYVFEFKMDDRSTAEAALAQIDQRDYPIQYTADHRPTVKIGVEFSVEDGGIKRWLVAENN